MFRYGIAGVSFVLYAAVAVWLVGRTGSAHRESLHGSRVVVNESTPSDPSEAPATTAPKPVPAPIAPIAPAPPAPVPPAVVVAPEPKPSAPLVAVVPTPARPAAPKARETQAVRSEWANGLDLSRISPADESRLGREIQEMILETNPRITQGNYLQRVVRAARPLLDLRSRKDINYQFVVLDSDAVNAFSLPGGFVFVCRGLFDLIGEDEDFALTYLLAHEIAHVDKKHALTTVAPANAEAKKKGVETLKQFLLPIVLGYPDAMEFEADAWAYQRMTGDLQQSKYRSLRFLRKFGGYAEANGFVDGHSPPNPKGNPIENHFKAHPAAWDRLDHLTGTAKPQAQTPKAAGTSK